MDEQEKEKQINDILGEYERQVEILAAQKEEILNDLIGQARKIKTDKLLRDIKQKS